MMNYVSFVPCIYYAFAMHPLLPKVCITNQTLVFCIYSKQLKFVTDNSTCFNNPDLNQTYKFYGVQDFSVLTINEFISLSGYTRFALAL